MNPVFIPTANPPIPDLAARVDELGALRAHIAQLNDRAETLRAELESAGLQHIDGTLYRATITQCAGAVRVNWQAVAQRFKPSPQLIRAYTTHGKESTRLNITARN